MDRDADMGGPTLGPVPNKHPTLVRIVTKKLAAGRARGWIGTLTWAAPCQGQHSTLAAGRVRGWIGTLTWAAPCQGQCPKLAARRLRGWIGTLTWAAPCQVSAQHPTIVRVAANKLAAAGIGDGSER